MPDDDPTPPTLKPIVGDPGREAVATLRGYFYQVWQSVHAWIALRDGELLFLEKAEDFDLVCADGATTVQVFDSEQTITLRTEKVRKSIANFWMHRTRNPDRPIKFRFLTRAKIGVEQNEPFGPGIAGLKVWSGPLHDEADIARLGTFIAALGDIPAELQEFLRTASPAQIAERLLRPMHWDVENADSSYVEAEIRRMLAEFGAHQGVPYSDAVRVADRLYREVCTVASSSGDRVLTRARFLEIFERETSERIPRQEALMLREVVAAMGRVGPPAPSSDHFVVALENHLQGAPPLPQVVAHRDALVASLRTKLNSSGTLVLIGSSGMGKTTLAKLIIASDAAEWIWVRVGRTNATALIQQLGRRIDADPRIRSVVLDDVDLSPVAARDLEEVLGGVLYAATERRGRVLITAQSPLPARLARFLGVSEEHTIAVPPLTVEEIGVFAVQLGCSDAGLAKQWSRIALLKTRGHPQLVAAHLTFLRQNNWPAVAAKDLVGPASAVVREQEDARQLLDALPPDERELIYRLSVFRNPFRADHARSVGGKLRALPQPGSLFERIRGSWIEPLHHDYFRVSTLIQRAGEQVFAPDQLRGLHSAIVEVVRDCPPATTLEAATAFHHAWLARDPAALVGLVASIMNVEPDMFAAIAQNLEWFSLEALIPSAVLFTENRTLSRMLRMIQFRIADVLRAYDVAGVVVLRWDQEATDGEGALNTLGRVMLAVSAIGHADVPVRPPALLRYFGYLLEAEHAGIDLSQVTRRGEGALPVLSEMPDLLSQLVIFVAARSVDSEYLEELLDALDTAPPGLRERMFNALRRLPVELRLMVQRPWLTEDQRQQPDWPRCLKALHKAFALGLKWGVPQVSIAALRAITVITDEHLHRSSDALQLIERLAREAGLTSHVIEDAHATVLFNQGRYEEALAEWESALAHWPASEEKHDIADSLAARMAAVSAARIDRWDRAAALLMEAHRLLRDASYRPYSVGLLTDAGFAHWRAGAFADSAGALGQALAESEHLPQGRENFAAFQARKILGHVILWLHNTITGESTDSLMPPQAGMGSDMEKRERLLEIPDGAPDAPWLLFLRVHERLRPGVRPPDQLQRRLQQSPSTSIRFIAAGTAIRRAFRETTFDDLPSQCVELTKAMIDIRVMGGQAVTFTTPDEAATGGTRFLTDNRTVGVELFVAALLALAGEQRLDRQVVAAWRNSARSLLAAADFTRLCDLVDRILALSLIDATRLLRDQNTPRESRLLAVVNVALSPEADAEELFSAHCLLVDCFAGGYWLVCFGGSFARLVERSWRDQIRSSATLSNPRVSVPAITAACDANETSLAKLSNILLAASQAVRIRIPQALVEKIRSLPNSPGADAP